MIAPGDPMNRDHRSWDWIRRITKGYHTHIALGAASLLLVDLLELIPPRMLGALVDSVTRHDSSWPPLMIAGAYIGSFVLMGLVRYPMRMGLVGAACRISGDLRDRYDRALVLMPHADVRSRRAGEWISRVTGDLGAVEGALSTGLMFFFDCLFYLLVIPGAMIFISPYLCAVALLALPAIAILSSSLVRRITHASEEVQESSVRLFSQALENVEAVYTVRAYGLEEREVNAFTEAADGYVAKDLHRVRLESFFAGAVQIAVAVGVFFVLLLGGQLAIAGKLSMGQFIIFLQYMGMMAWPLSGLAWSLLLFRKGEVAFRRIEEIMSKESFGLRESDSASPIKGALEIRDLSYRHPGNHEPVLSHVSLSIRPGERIAVLGPLGSGKSTLLDLVLRILEPPPGTVLVDGVDVVEIPLTQFRHQVSASPQDCFLFSGTIRANIALASREEADVSEAAVRACVGGPEFSSGLDTPTGEKGAGLSGGQRQRVALARAIARRPAILVIDDASSALDEDTEERVFQGLGSGTVLYTTARISRAREADRIVVLVHGRILEEGSHEELLSRKGPYADWVGKQAFTHAVEEP